MLLSWLVCTSGATEPERFVPGRILVKPKSTLADSEFTRRLNRRGVLHSRLVRHSNVRVVVVPEAKTDALLAELGSDADIEFAERDYIAQASLSPNDPYVGSGAEWHLSKIQAQQAWDITCGASNVIIAVLDSGVNAAHPDLAGRVLPGYDFVWGDNDPSDDFGHGTAVAGAIVASGNNGIGVAGVAFGCSVLPVKVMDASGSASHSTLAEGIEYAVAQGARIINLSLGGDWPSSTLQDAINFAWSNNVIVVAAAGNGGGTVPQYPAACDHVIAVAASEADDSRAWFSSYGSFVTLFAPGTDIWTSQRDLNNPYGAWNGTSFACPVVAGVAALVASANPSLSNTQVVELLKQTADDLGPAGYDTSFGYGRVNAFRAVNSAGGGSPSVPASPVVRLTDPLNGTDFPPGTAINLAVTASSSSGAITNVTFFANGGQIGNLIEPPFTLDWMPAQAGSYTLSVVAIDENGMQGTSAPVTLHISSPESTAPLITITTSPADGARLISAVVTLTGTANDNVGVARVEIQLNNSPTLVANGTLNWSAQIALAPGVNTVRVRSVDLAGNISSEVIRTFTYVMSSLLTVQTDGIGMVTPNLNGRQLEVGKVYKVKAAPGPGQVFAGWEGTSSQQPALSFVMQSNLVLVAKFIPNPFPAVKGNYAGLVANTNGVTPGNSGYFNLTVTSSGVFSGKLQIGGVRHSFRGRLNLAGDAAVSVRRGVVGPLTLSLHVNLGNITDQTTGSVTDGYWTSALAGDRNVFSSRLNPARQAGLRLFVLERAEDNAAAAAGSSKILAGGAAQVRGTLSDGRRFTTSSMLAKNGDCPFYLSLNQGNEVVIGWLNFPAGQGPTASGTVLWVKTGTNAFAATLRATAVPSH